MLLRYLRERDYKRFEWLLEKLDLYYRPRPFFWERVERKKHLGRDLRKFLLRFKSGFAAVTVLTGHAVPKL